MKIGIVESTKSIVTIKDLPSNTIFKISTGTVWLKIGRGLINLKNGAVSTNANTDYSTVTEIIGVLKIED